MSTEPPINPLSEAEPNSLEEFFSRDPFEFTRKDRDIIVRELRKQREAWNLAEAAGAKRAPAASKTGPTPSLKDLGLL